jgi:GNAT superfamily N-acetyltransferase
MKIYLKPEYEINAVEQQQIFDLRRACFTDYEITNHYGKQLPTARIMTYLDTELTGHIGLMLRMVRINETERKVMGLQDVIVTEAHRGRGIMTKMIEKAESTAIRADCEFMMLFTTEPEIYERFGFKKVVVDMQWLKIHEGRNLGTGLEKVEETMVKYLGTTQMETIQSIDMLGHIF